MTKYSYVKYVLSACHLINILTTYVAIHSCIPLHIGLLSFTGHSGVPKDLCAAEYINAFREFADSNTGSLVEVHFIDQDQDMLDMVINAHKSMI